MRGLTNMATSGCTSIIRCYSKAMLKVAIAARSCKNYPYFDDQFFYIPLKEFESRGCTLDVIPWNTNGVKWEGYDLVLPLGVWWYHEDADRFKQWVIDVGESGTRLANSRDMILWNMHKGYLLDLECDKVNIPDTILLRKSDSAPDLAKLMMKKKWEKMYVKPAVGGAGWHVYRIFSDREAKSFQEDFRQLLQNMDIIIQKAVIGGVGGEWSLLYINGKYAQCIQKVPDEGVYTFGPRDAYRISRQSPPESVRQMADCTVKRLPFSTLYARIDIKQDHEKKPFLMEAECIEPGLCLDDTTGKNFVDAVISMAKNSRK